MGLMQFITILNTTMASGGNGGDPVSITTDSTEYTIDSTELYTIDTTLTES